MRRLRWTRTLDGNSVAFGGCQITAGEVAELHDADDIRKALAAGLAAWDGDEDKAPAAPAAEAEESAPRARRRKATAEPETQQQGEG